MNLVYSSNLQISMNYRGIEGIGIIGQYLMSSGLFNAVELLELLSN